MSFSPHPVTAPRVTVPRVTSSQVEYETTAHGSATRVIAGYEVTALQYQVFSTGLQHGHLVMVGGVQHQQWWMLPLEKQVGHAWVVIVNLMTACVVLKCELMV